MQNNSTCSIVAIVVNHSLLVCTTRAKNLRNFFRPYFFGNDGLTGPYVRSGATPALYLLESLDNSTRIQATSARIAWTHLLHNHGYQIINENALTQPLHPNDQQKLGQISSTYDLEALLHPNRELSQNFHYAPPRTYRVSFPVSPERHQELLDAARDLDMTLQDYCQAQFDLRMIQRPTLSELRNCALAVDEIQRTCTNLQNSALLYLQLRNMPLKNASSVLAPLPTEIHLLSQAIDDLNHTIQQLYYGDD